MRLKTKQKLERPANKMANLEALVVAVAVGVALFSTSQLQVSAIAPPPPQADKPQQATAAGANHRPLDRQRGNGQSVAALSSSQQRTASSETPSRSHQQTSARQQQAQSAAPTSTTTTTTSTTAAPAIRTYHNHRGNDEDVDETSAAPDAVDDLSTAASSASGSPSEELSGEADDSAGGELALSDVTSAAEDEAEPTEPSPAAAQEGPESRVGVSAGPVRRESETRQNTTTTTTGRPQQAQTRTRQPTLITSTIASSLNVDMGADRMMIKPHTANARAGGGTRSPVELATESVLNHVLVSARDGQPESRIGAISERRQNMLFPHSSNGGGNYNEPPFEDELGGGQLVGPSPAPNYYANSQQQPPQLDSSALVVAGICYTPLALLSVILVTVAITVAVCFCAHYLIRHLARRQFDLTDNSKYFADSKQRTLLAASRPGGGNCIASAATPPSWSRSQVDGARHQPPAGRVNLAHQFGTDDEETEEELSSAAAAANQAAPSLLQLFQSGGKCCSHGQSSHFGAASCVGRNCTFSNPYFAPEESAPAHLQCESAPATCVLVGGQQPAAQRAPARRLQSSKAQHASGLLLQTIPSEQIHFIENRIASLHDKQVTSSVRELSKSGNNPQQLSAAPSPGHVVDLTSSEQRAKVIADPQEGDLIAVDISGHDIVGLGFDVCGNSRDGIFVSSVFSRGPARESGCINSGDRIKCLNISFDEITLQDAHSLLNCGAPYKMRLLLEKKVATQRALKKLACCNERAAISKSPSSARLYLKRLADKLSLAPDGASLARATNRIGPTDSMGTLLHAAPPLGSVAARQALQESGQRESGNQFEIVEEDGSCNQIGLVNEAFGSDSDDSEHNAGGGRLPSQVACGYALRWNADETRALAENKPQGAQLVAGRRDNLDKTSGGDVNAAFRPADVALHSKRGSPLRPFDKNQSQPEIRPSGALENGAEIRFSLTKGVECGSNNSAPSSNQLAGHSVSTPTVHLLGRCSSTKSTRDSGGRRSSKRTSSDQSAALQLAEKVDFAYKPSEPPSAKDVGR